MVINYTKWITSKINYASRRRVNYHLLPYISMKKIFLLLVVISWIWSFTSAFDFSSCEQRWFTVTAYYSPESGQAFYYKPTFQQEVILNGEGLFGASGKKVFNGMLAGPSSYPFGSILYFPWLWLGEIADRGGAIVLSWEKWQTHDRIDVWMGKGEQWLIRALIFGKKNMTGYVCDSTNITTSAKDTLLRDSVPVLKNFFDIALWIQQLDEGRSDIWTRTLQKYLVKLWYLNKKYWNGSYESNTKKALCTYQVAKKIVSSKSPDCWIFGSMTRYTMKLDVQSKNLLPSNLYTTGTFASIIDLAKHYNGKANIIVTKSLLEKGGNEGGFVTIKSTKVFLFYRAYTKWQQSSEIKILQTFLQLQWLYSGTIDGIYSQSTMNAVYEFQKKYTLISDKDPLILRGFLWPKTRAKINELRQK